MILDYDRNPRLSAHEQIESFAESVQRALEGIEPSAEQKVVVVGGKGIGDKNYVHTQNQVSAEWTVTHNLNKHPAVTVIDSAGTAVVGEVEYIDVNTCVLKFIGAFSGKAYFN